MIPLARILVVLCLIAIGSGCSREVKFSDSPRSGPVVVLGDSLSEGYEVKPEEGFVSVLAERLKLEIVNLGRKGITTEESLPRVKEEVLPLKPSIVVIQLGGNDALQKKDPAQTRANLQSMIDQLQAESIPIVLLGVRGGLLSDKFEEMFEDLASDNGLAFVPDILDGILTSPSLRVDNVHPNKAGHEVIADRVEPVLREVASKVGLLK